MKILVCGGRDFDDYEQLLGVLEAFHEMCKIECVVHGDASGADRFSGQWASINHVRCKPYPAEWSVHGRYAGPMRNRFMLEDNPDIELVIAFPGGRGTEGMIKLAEKAGIQVFRV